VPRHLFLLGFWLLTGTASGGEPSPESAPERTKAQEGWSALGRELAQRPSPLDRLDRSQIPAEARLSSLGNGTVAVIGHPHSETEFWVRCLAYSPDGKTLASGSNNGLVRLWDTTTFQPLAVLEGCSDSVKALAFSRNGQELRAASWKETVCWSLDGPQPK